MNIVIPMAGEGSRFLAAGYDKPKPFIDVLGQPMITHVMNNVNYPNARFILIGRKQHLNRFPELVNEISINYNVIFVEIDDLTEGTACTVLYARNYINNDEPLLIANSDQIVDCNIISYIEDSKKRNLDGSILTFEDEELNPKWSFAKLNSQNLVVEVQEKKAISKYATVGIYYFEKGRDFVNGAIDMIVRNDRVNNEFYTCPVYNYLIKSNKKIGIFNMNFSEMHGLGTPSDLEKFCSSKIV